MSVIAATALVLAAFVLIQQPAEASPGRAPVAAAVAGVSAVIDVVPQFAGQFTNFICALLLSIFSSFQSSPFFSFIAGILNSILAGFGCLISGG